VGLAQLIEDRRILVPAHIAARYEQAPNQAVRVAARRTAHSRGLDQWAWPN